MNFSIIILNQSINKMKDYGTWIQIALSFILRLKMFMKTSQMMLKKDDLIHQIMQSREHCLQEKKQKSAQVYEKLVRWKG